jgi:N,N-dimethylformamidase
MINHPQQIFGYSDRFAARPGEALSFHVSCEHVTNYQASLVRLRHGFTGDAGPGFLETAVPAEFEGTYRGAWFACQPGSYVEVPDEAGKLGAPDDFLIEAHVFSTLPLGARSGHFGAYHVTQNSFGESSGMQAVLGNWSEAAQTGYALALDQGKATFIWNDGVTTQRLSLEAAVEAHQWYKLRVRIVTSEGKVHLEQVPMANIMNRHAAQTTGSAVQSASAAIAQRWSTSEAPFRIGALARKDGYRWLAASAFNGKIGGVTIWRGASEPAQDVVAAWHFGQSNRADGLLLGAVVDKSPNKLHGHCHNTPTRGVTGHRFAGLVEDFRLVPDEYDAIHFHDDDITDAEWPAAFTFKVPQDLPAGVYAAKLTSEDAEYYIPFFVRAGQKKAEIAVLFSTATYLAYANDRIAFEANGAEIIVSRTPIIDPADLTLQDHPEFGRSCYEIHNDGSGVVFGSPRRPILTLQPKHRAWFQADGVWGLPADLCIVHWLETMELGFDPITDEDLDREGIGLLQDYKVVITGSHPEYVTRNEITAIDQYCSSGGRLMYLGGNGFFATVSFDPEQPSLMELRRSDAGTRPHQSPFGDRRHTTSGETAGLWRNKGLPPQRLVGVGFAAQGFDRCTYYQRLEDSHNPIASFVFEGIGADEQIGGFGIMGGGAAGAEVDCYQPVLGTPPQTLLLATSGPLSDAYLLAAEEVYESIPGIGGTEQPGVRADIVLCPLDGGGAFFSVGSIAYTGSLSHNKYDNNVSRMTSNVLRRFLQPEALDVVL